MNVATLTADLIAEQEALEAVVAPLHAEDWALATPSPRWSVADQIAHLTYFDEAADELTLGELRMLEPPQLLDRWRRPATDRLRHVVQLGFITRGWSYANRGLEPPAAEVRLEIGAPSGAIWEFGPAEAPESAAGPAEDFCLVVTQRRHLDDTGLRASPGARDWLLIAQAFAGPPTDGPAPGARA